MGELKIEPRKRVLPEFPASISSLSGELSQDKRKVRVSVELSREDTRPDLDLSLSDSTKTEICHSTIIENFGARMDFTLHIREEGIQFPMVLKCQLSYLDDEIFSEKECFIPEE